MLWWFYWWVEYRYVSPAIYCCSWIKFSYGRQSDTRPFDFPLINADVDTQTREHARSMWSSSCSKHLSEVRHPRVNVSSAAFAFLQRIFICISFSLWMQSNEPTETHMWLWFLSALSSCSTAQGASSRKAQPHWIAGRRKHRISILRWTQWTSSRAHDLLTYWTAHNCFLSPYLLAHGLITGWTVVQAAGSFHLRNPVQKLSRYYLWEPTGNKGLREELCWALCTVPVTLSHWIEWGNVSKCALYCMQFLFRLKK